MTTEKNNGKFFLGALFGGIIGGITALMMAPQSGDETQRLILKKRENLRHEAEQRILEGRQYTQGKINEARNAVSEWLSTGSEILNQKSHEVKVNNGKNANRSEKEKVAA